MSKKLFQMILTLTGVCLTTTPALSQNEDHCYPNTTTNVSPSCPTITDNGAIAPTSFCVNQGSDPDMPQLIEQPKASSGNVVTTKTTTFSNCSTTNTSSTNTVTYSFSGLKYRNGNGPPTKFSPPNTYQADYYITITSSDTNNCNPDSPVIDYGQVTWNVINPFLNINGKGYQWVPQWANEIDNLAAGWFDIGTFSAITGTDIIDARDFCCNGNKSHVQTGKIAVDAGTQTINATLKTANLTAALGKIIGDVLKGIGAVDNSGAVSTGITAWLNSQIPSAGVGGVTCSVNAKFNIIDYSQDCDCPNAASTGVWSGSDGASASCSVLSVSVPPDLLAPLGINFSLDCTLVIGDLSYKKEGSDQQFSQTSPSVNHTVTTTTHSDIHTHWQIGTFKGDYYEVPKTDAVNPVTSTVCEGQFYP